MNIYKIKTVSILLIAGLFSVSAMAADNDSTTSVLAAEKEVQPIYPKKALDRKISGYALVKYRIGSNGHPRDINIVESQPSGVFDAASRRAVIRTKFATEDASKAKGETFYKMYVYELDENKTGTLAANN